MARKTKSSQKNQTVKRIIYILLIIILAVISYYAKKNKSNTSDRADNQRVEFARASKTDTTQLVVMFYNLENLFDTIDDPHNHYDNEYTPTGEKHWNTKRYLLKLRHIARVILDANKNEAPDLIGVCEVENRQVLEDLINKTPLKNYGYGIVHRETKDIRGIDLALLYKKAEFQPLEVKQFPIYYSKRPARTRQILYIKGILKNGDTLHIFLNHWKSRLSRGNSDSEYKRIAAAKSLKKAIKQVLKQNPDARIIIMGDFNDEPTNKSIKQALGAKGQYKPGIFLYNAMYAADSRKEGTYVYQGKWLMFDNIIVRPILLDTTQNLYLEDDGRVLKLDYLVTYKRGKPTVNRTFKGEHYLGGYSDHLPVEVVLRVKY